MPITDPTDISNLGLWVQPRDINSLAQSISGFTPIVGDGDPVGKVFDKSGTDFDLVATGNDGTRPTYNDVAGVQSITFTAGNSNKLIRTAALGMYAAGAASIFIAVKGNPANDARLLGDASSTNNSPFYAFQAGNGIFSSTFLGGFIRNDANGGVFASGGNARQVIGEACFDDTDRVVGWVDDGANITGWLDGVEKTAQSYTRTGTLNDLDQFGLGCLFRATPVSFFTFTLYELVIYLKALNDTEAADVSTYLALSQSPVAAAGNPWYGYAQQKARTFMGWRPKLWLPEKPRLIGGLCHA